MRRNSYIYTALFTFVTTTCVVISMNKVSQAAGEKYSSEGNNLSRAIVDNMVMEGLCRDVADCFKRIDSYGGDGNKVNITYYGATDKSVIKSIVAYALTHGLERTNGVSIRLIFHEETRAYQGNSLSKRPPVVALEINK